MRTMTMLLAATLALAPVAVAAQAVDAPAGAYEIDPTHASVNFRVSHLGLSRYTARFTKFTSTVTLDPADLTRSTLRVSIDPKSIRTDYPFPEKEDFDAELAGPKWLNAAKFPAITFVSRSITRTGPNTGRVAGDLTMHGVTKPVTLTATFNGTQINRFSKKPMLGVSATGTIKRSEFGVSGGIPFVGDDVELLIEAEYAKAG